MSSNNLREIDKGIFVDPDEVVSVENNGYWKPGDNPSNGSTWTESGSRLILKNGRKVNTKLTPDEVLKNLNRVGGINA